MGYFMRALGDRLRPLDVIVLLVVTVVMYTMAMYEIAHTKPRRRTVCPECHQTVPQPKEF